MNGTRAGRSLALGVAVVLAAGLLGACSHDRSADGPEGRAAVTSHLTEDTIADAITAGMAEMTSYRTVGTFGGDGVMGSELDGSVTVVDLLNTGEGQDVHVTMAMGDQDFEAFVVGGEVWMRVGGEVFVHATAEDAALDPDLAELLKMAAPTDIAAQAQGFVTALKSFETLGADVVDGVETWGFAIPVDPACIPEAQQTMAPQQLALVKEMTATYWFGVDSVPRKCDVAITMNNGFVVTMQSTISLINEVAPITPPPDSVVIEYADW